EFGFDALDKGHVASLAAIGEPLEILTCLIALDDRQENAGRRYQLACHGFIVARDKFRRSGLAPQPWATLPCVPVCTPRAIRELLGDAVDAFKTYAHVWRSRYQEVLVQNLACSPSQLLFGFCRPE